MEGRPRQDPPPHTVVQPPVGTRQPPAGVRTTEDELEGVRAWLADIDRKLGTRTYAGAAAVVLATAAAIVAIVLAIDARDNSAGQADVERLETQISEVARRAGAAQSTGQDLSSLESRITELEAQIGSSTTTTSDLEGRIGALESDIEALQGEAGGGGPSPASGAAVPGTSSDSGGRGQEPGAGDEAPSGDAGGGTGP